MRAGKLRHRITIQDKTVSQNDYGEEIITWTDVDTLWGSVEPLRGREYIQARQEQAAVTTRIRCRHRSSITPSMRAVHDGRNYEILSVINPAERNIQMELMCREDVNS